MVPSGLTEAVPWVGSTVMVTSRVWPASFGPAVSPVRTSMPLAVVSSAVVAESSSAVGASLTSVTVILKVSGALVSRPPPSSCRRTVRFATPLAFAAGVKVSVPSASMAGWTRNRSSLSLLTRKSRAWPLSSAGPALMPVAQAATLAAPESSATVWSPPAVKVGVSLTAVTVIETVTVLLSVMPSFAWYVNESAPLKSAARACT